MTVPENGTIEPDTLPAPMSLQSAAEHAVRLLGITQKELSSLPQRRAAMVRQHVEIVRNELARALDAHSEAATRDLRETLLTALGPDLRWGEAEGARRMLEVLLACLDSDRPAAKP